MPIIILEGIDGAGKSTLAERLASSSPIPARVSHQGPLERSAVEEYLLPLYQVSPDELFIADRWHVSETIYGPLYRGVSAVSPALYQAIEEALASLGAVKVLVRPSYMTVVRRLATRGEGFLQPEDYTYTYRQYTEVGLLGGYRVVRDSSDETIQDLLVAAGVTGVCSTKKV